MFWLKFFEVKEEYGPIVDISKRLAGVVAIVVGLLIAFSYFVSSSLHTFFLFIGIGLVTRYPKVRIDDGFIITDMTDLVVFLAAMWLGLPHALAIIIIGNWVPQLYTRAEGPHDAGSRTISMIIGLFAFYLFNILGLQPLAAIAWSVLVSTSIWAAIGWFMTPHHRFFAAAIVKPVFYYRLMQILNIV